MEGRAHLEWRRRERDLLGDFSLIFFSQVRRGRALETWKTLKEEEMFSLKEGPTKSNGQSKKKKHIKGNIRIKYRRIYIYRERQKKREKEARTQHSPAHNNLWKWTSRHRPAYVPMSTLSPAAPNRKKGFLRQTFAPGVRHIFLYTEKQSAPLSSCRWSLNIV